MDNLHHHLTRFDGGQHVLAEGFLLYGVGECLGNFIIDVGVEQCATHILQGFCNVDLSDFALSFKELEASLEAFA